MKTVEDLVSYMAAARDHREVQIVQTAYRVQLIKSWNITAGEKILEIGCGQGDTTVVLADAVGESGHVLAIDRAPGSYGAPVTLQQSMDFFLTKDLGSRVEVRFGCDLLDASVSFRDREFDAIVLSHCSWYFASLDQLKSLFLKIRPWAKRLYFAEWDLALESSDQTPHLLAVLVQGLIASHTADSEANVRTPFPKATLKSLLAETGWNVVHETSLATTGLQDADWEVGGSLRPSPRDLEDRAKLQPRQREFLESQLETLRTISKPKGNCPLPAYSIIAE